MQLRQQFSTFQAAKVLVVVVVFTFGERLVVILEVDYLHCTDVLIPDWISFLDCLLKSIFGTFQLLI